MVTTYEWIVEEIDEHGDIIDVWHYDSRSEAVAAAAEGPSNGGVRMQVGLVRDVGNEAEGLVDRSWSYLDDAGRLPERFTYGMGEEGAAVPKRFRS